MFSLASAHKAAGTPLEITAAVVPNADWLGAAGNGSRYVLTGITDVLNAGGISATSTDGLTWTQGSISPTLNLIWNGAAYGNGLFVTMASDSRAFAPYFYKTNLYATSPDGVNWTERTLPTSDVWYDVAFNGSRFVAVGLSGSAYSLDGTNWTANAQGGRAIASNGSRFSTLSHITIDGITWTPRVTPFGSGNYITIGGNTNGFLVISQSGGTQIYCYFSTDGLNWTQRTLPVGYSGATKITSNGTYFIVSGNSDGLWRTVNGTSWTYINPFPISLRSFTATSRNQSYIVDTNPIVVPESLGSASTYIGLYPAIPGQG